MKRFYLGLLSTLALGLLIIFGLLSYAIDGFPIAPPERRAIDSLVDGRKFNFAIWELEALVAKAGAGLASGAAFLPEEDQARLVRDYAKVVGEVRRLERELDTMFAESDEPQLDSAELQQQLVIKRAELKRLQPVAEGALQTQVDVALAEAGFDILGGVWPPVAGRMTPLPLMLVVSPRDRIEQKYAFALENGMSVAARDELEQQIFKSQELSALVVPIGGLGIFPSMIVETGNLTFLANTYAHEWAHHRLSLNPLGLNYAKSTQLRTMNETTASIVGEEIGRIVLTKHYPELLPPPAPEVAPELLNQSTAPHVSVEPVGFDFGFEMNETRERVDALMAAGQLDEADAYMESRRLIFVENGYLIRKLNQAYFAFYGGYATTPGAQGSDPVGPAVLTLREESDSLFTFLESIKSLSSFEQLQALLNGDPE